MKRGRLLRVFVHNRFEERFIMSRTNSFPVKSFTIDTTEKGLMKAEFEISEFQDITISYEGDHCKDYSAESNSMTDFEGYKDCVTRVFRSDCLLIFQKWAKPGLFFIC